jgi:Tfp pilus assembly protein PilO
MNKKIKWTLTGYQKMAFSIWGVAGVLLAVGYFAFYLPQHQSLSQLHQKYEDSGEQAALAKKAACEQTRLQLEQQTEQVAGQLNAFTVPSDQVNRLVFEIGRIAGQLNLGAFASKNLDVQSAAGKPNSKSMLSEVWLSVEFRGSYEQFARFVNLLERNSPVIFVEKVFINRSRKESYDCAFQMELSILTTTGINGRALAMMEAGGKLE